MTATAADALRMLAPSTPDAWPAGILVAAALRRARTDRYYDGHGRVKGIPEVSQEHALAAVDHWRGTVRRHNRGSGDGHICLGCSEDYPCPDLTEVADEAREYVRGST